MLQNKVMILACFLATSEPTHAMAFPDQRVAKKLSTLLQKKMDKVVAAFSECALPPPKGNWLAGGLNDPTQIASQSNVLLFLYVGHRC